MVIWLIGLAGAGKTTLGRHLHDLMKKRNRATIFLDGDALRDIIGDSLGHTLEDRRTNGARMSRFCKIMDDQEFDVVCCVLSLFHDQQKWNRDNFSDYFEVFIDVPFDVLEARDQKGLYSGARAGRISNVVGFDIPFAPPVNPDLTLRNGETREDLTELAAQVLTAIDGRDADKRRPCIS